MQAVHVPLDPFTIMVWAIPFVFVAFHICFEDKESVRDFIRVYTKLVYEYKMIGLIYDFYDEKVVYRKENRKTLYGVQDVVFDLLEFLSMFPDMTVDLESVIISGDAETGYKVWRRMRYHGTNVNPTRFGAPTFKELGDGCLGLSMMFINKQSGSWKITEEHNPVSFSHIRETCTADA